jgi:hypothetical protein
MNSQQATLPVHRDGSARDTSPATANSPRLLDETRRAIRYRHYSYRTEQAYVEWTRRFVRFHGMRHPREMGDDEVAAFLDHRANARDEVRGALTHAHVLNRGCRGVVSPLDRPP